MAATASGASDSRTVLADEGLASEMTSAFSRSIYVIVLPTRRTSVDDVRLLFG